MGCSILVAGFDEKTKTPSLYQIDPSGSFWSWKATGIGKDSVTTKQFLEKRFISFHTFLISIPPLDMRKRRN